MTGRVSEADSPRVRFAGAVAGHSGEANGSVLNADELLKLSAVIGRKWTPAVMTTLAEHPMRHGDLCRKLSGIHRKVLQQSLTGLMHDGLITKSSGFDETGHPKTTYRLTELGASLFAVFDAMQDWCSQHLGELRSAQRDADSGAMYSGID